MNSLDSNTIVKLKRILLYIICLQTIIFVIMTIRNPVLWIEYFIIISINIIGCACIWFLLLKNNVDNADKVHGKYTSLEDTIIIADITLPYFRQGLNRDTATVIAKIVKNISNVPAVEITDRKDILAFEGTTCENRPVGSPIRTQATLDAIENGETIIITNKKELRCKVKKCSCPLESAVIVPLFNKNEVIGSLKFYDTKKGKMSNKDIKLASGIGKLLNMQIELADLDRQTQLATKAKLDALQAQINPHFLFNALNTINMYINKDAEFARKLIVRLSTLLRYLLGNYGRFISLGEELSYIEDYIVIESARFKDRLKIIIDVDNSIRKIQIPVLTIQPLVQNAIIHGILPVGVKGTVKITAHALNDEVVISVVDDGIGMTEEQLEKVFEGQFAKGCGVGIPNVNERLKILYGEEYGLKIESQYNVGTNASFIIP